MNRLYGLLVSKVPAPSGWYAKEHTPVSHSVKSQALYEAFTANVPVARLPLFACVVCQLAMKSMFKDEILTLDSENTYSTVVRNPESPSGSTSDVLSDLLMDHESMHQLCRYLDDDIRDRLVVPTWAETASAVCLQLLRSAL